MAGRLREQMEADVQRTFLNADEFAEFVTRFPAGNLAAGIEVKGIWKESDSRRDNQQGDRTHRRGMLLIAAAVPVMLSDRWEIGGELWDVERQERIVVGLRYVELLREERRATRPGRMR